VCARRRRSARRWSADPGAFPRFLAVSDGRSASLRGNRREPDPDMADGAEDSLGAVEHGRPGLPSVPLRVVARGRLAPSHADAPTWWDRRVGARVVRARRNALGAGPPSTSFVRARTMAPVTPRPQGLPGVLGADDQTPAVELIQLPLWLRIA
jgi:hypothetical protein